MLVRSFFALIVHRKPPVFDEVSFNIVEQSRSRVQPKKMLCPKLSEKSLPCEPLASMRDKYSKSGENSHVDCRIRFKSKIFQHTAI